MPGKPTTYASYLLRLWQADEAGRHIWRASLESTGTGERSNFANLEALLDFLTAQFRSIPGSRESSAPPEGTPPAEREKQA